MKRILFLLVMLSVGASAHSQSIENQINMDVWYPLMQSYNDFDAQKYVALHTQDAVKKDLDTDQSISGSNYAKSLSNDFSEMQAQGFLRSVNYTFTSRNHTASNAVDKGYFKRVTAQDGLERVDYGSFVAQMRKENGEWKIYEFSVGEQRGEITESDFVNATALPGL